MNGVGGINFVLTLLTLLAFLCFVWAAAKASEPLGKWCALGLAALSLSMLVGSGVVLFHGTG